MPKFRKKPVVIEAIQYTRTNVDEIADFVQPHPLLLGENTPAGVELIIVTLEDGANGEAQHVASPGDWIIKGIQGECYPCKPDIFRATYELIA